MMVKRLTCSLWGALVSLLLLCGSAGAATPAAGWTVDSLATPTVFSMNHNALCAETLGVYNRCDAYKVTVTNRGGQPTDGSPVTIADVLPAGLTARGISLFLSGEPNHADFGGFLCQTVAVRCVFPAALAPDETLQMIVYVTVGAGAAGSLSNAASVSGGGVGEASASVRNTNGPTPAPFGVSAFNLNPFGSDGARDIQAGAHPYELGTAIALNNMLRTDPESAPADTSIQDVKDVVVDLPVGFVGSALAAPTCTLAQLPLGGGFNVGGGGGCPASDTRGGHILVEPGNVARVNSGLFNVVPESGVAAQFGFTDVLRGTHVLHSGVVATPAGYALRTTS